MRKLADEHGIRFRAVNWSMRSTDRTRIGYYPDGDAASAIPPHYPTSTARQHDDASDMHGSRERHRNHMPPPPIRHLLAAFVHLVCMSGPVLPARVTGEKEGRVMVESLQCVSGVLVSDPCLSISPVGRCRFAVPVEVSSGTSGRHAATRARAVATLVVVGPVAERAYAQFTGGDHFLAQGAWGVLGATAFEERDGGDEFLARYLGHDLLQHHYAVDRTRRRGWQPHAPAHLLTTDWAAPLLHPVDDGGPVAS